MYTLITTCPSCFRPFEADPEDILVTCAKCGHRYDLSDPDADTFDPDPDFGGAFDGLTVQSDADAGL
jgi:hypothetical protein